MTAAIVAIAAAAGLRCCCRQTDSCVAVLGTREVTPVDRVAKNLNAGGYCIFGGKTDVAYQTGSDIEGTLRIVMPQLDKNASAEELSEAAEAQGRRLQVPFCRELIRHKDKLDAAFRARIGMGKVDK
ncbi:MAG: hypothetical protein ACI4QF_08115 [Kiritimatiellia bacterium]